MKKSKMLKSFRANPILFLFISLLVPRLILMYFFGPLETMDTGGYAQYTALFFQEDFSWAHSINLTQHLDVGSSLFRSIGYPFFLSIFWFLTPSYWQISAVLVQVFLSCFSFCILGYFLKNLLPSKRIAYISVFLSSISQSLFFDSVLLPDSLTASFFLLSMSLLGIRILKKNGSPALIPFSFILSIVLCWVWIFLLRANGIILVLAQLPLLLLVLRPFSLQRKTYYAFCFLIPVGMSYLGYLEWNVSRTGERFLTTGGRTVFFQPLFALAEKGDPLFKDNSLLGEVVQEKVKDYSFKEILDINESLFNQKHLSAVVIQKMIFQKYIDSIIEDPLRLFKIMHVNTSTKIVTSLANPTQSLSMFFNHCSFEPFIKPPVLRIHMLKTYLKTISSISFKNKIFILSSLFWNGFSILLFLSFLGLFFSKIFRIFTTHKIFKASCDPLFITIWLSFIYIGIISFYALIHLELRYLLPVYPIPVFMGMEGLRRLYSFYTKHDKKTLENR